MEKHSHLHIDQLPLKTQDQICTEKLKTISDTPLFPLNFPELFRVAKMLLISSLPTSISQLSAVLIDMTSMGYVGSYGTPNELAGASLGHTWIFLFYLGVLLSLNAGFQITASQLFGANKRHELARVFQKTLIIFSILMVPLIILLLIVNRVLVRFGVDKDAAEQGEIYLLYYIPSLISIIFIECIKSYLLSQNYFYVQGIVKTVAISLNFLLCHVFIAKYEMNALVWSTIAKAITDVTILIAFIIYVRMSGITKDIPLKWNNASLQGLKEYFKQIFTIGTNIYIQWSMEGIFGFMISFQSNPAVIGANGLGSMFTVVIYTFPLGNSVTMQTYLGNAVGGGSRNRAKKIVAAAFAMNLVLSVISMLVMFVGNDAISTILTNDPETKEILKNVIYLYGIAYIADTYQEHISNVLRTTGQSHVVNNIAMIVYLGIGVPLEWLLGFPLGYGYVGMWSAIIFQTYLMLVLVFRLFMRLDWKLEIEKVRAAILEKEVNQKSKKEESLEDEEQNVDSD